MSYTRGYRSKSRIATRQHEQELRRGGFVCRHCGMEVSCAPEQSGVLNRNHCPYCLWSRHLDQVISGDRLAGCRAIMQPVALTAKPGRNKYTSEQSGELMIIHRCSGCAKLVYNRIAADDDPQLILMLIQAPSPELRADCARIGLPVLTIDAVELVEQRLFGRQSPRPLLLPEDAVEYS